MQIRGSGQCDTQVEARDSSPLTPSLCLSQSAKNGYVSKSDFDALYAEMVSQGLTSKSKETVFETLDSGNGDGRIQFSEYINWMKNQGIFHVALPQAQ